MATGATHVCRGAAHPETLKRHGLAIVHRLTRYELSFSAFMALAVMGLAIYSLPFPGNLVLGGVAALGVVLAVIKLLRSASGRAHERRGGA